MHRWNAIDVAWLAGIIEGEGCLSLKGHVMRIAVNMTDEDVIRRCMRVAALGQVTGPYDDGVSGHKPIFRWLVSDVFDVYALLAAIYSQLGERRRAKCEAMMREFRSLPVRPTRVHGTRVSYKRGCRCALCVEGQRAYSRERYARRSAA